MPYITRDFWAGCIAIGLILVAIGLAGCAGCPRDNPQCVPPPSPASIGAYLW